MPNKTREIMATARRQMVENPRPELVKWAKQMPPGVLLNPLGTAVRGLHALQDNFRRA